MRQTIVLSVLAILLAVAPAGAQSSPFGGGSVLSGWHPPVPTSAFSRASSWIDPQRLHFSTSVSVGSGWGGQGTNALQVTSLSYQFHAPVALSVSLGNAWGPSGASSNGNTMFLEGLRMAWQPRANTSFTFEYHQLRSPLQYGAYGYGQPLWQP